MTPKGLFAVKADYNTWLNQLTENERELIYELMEEYAEEVIPLDAQVMPKTCEHNYQIAKRDYFKPDGGQNVFGKTYNQETSYSMLYCTKCGGTKEIISSC